MNAFRAAIWALPVLLLAAASAVAEDVAVDVELVLAADVSRSMTPRELEIQRRGYAEALRSDDVVDAIVGGFHGRVAITYVEWAGAGYDRTVVGWTLLDGRAAAEAFADKLTAEFDSSMRRTSISGAIDFAAGLFPGNGFRSARQVIDISGDGPNNDGRPVTLARDKAVADGIVINGLPLMTREGMGAQWHLENLDDYYYNCVIGGTAAFVIPVTAWDQFADAVRRKLVLELSGGPPPPEPRFQLASAAAYDCLIGEKIWRSIWGDGLN